MTGFTFSDEYGLWARISYYQHPDPNMPEITLLPMVHLGEADYYREIRHEMWQHDTAYLEGCYVPSKRGLYVLHRALGFFSGLTLQSGKIPFFKKWSKENKNSGQCKLQERIRTHKCNCGQCYNFELRMVRADFHRFHAVKAIKTMPWWSKFAFPFIVLTAIIYAPFMNLRKHDFDENEEDDDSRDSFLYKFLKPYMKFMIEDRDLFLAMVLAEEIIADKNHNQKICVKYGAKHMPPLVDTFLSDFDYKLIDHRYVLAIAKSKSIDLGQINTGYGLAHTKLWDEEENRLKSQHESDFQNRAGKTFSIAPENITYNNSTNRTAQDHEYSKELFQLSQFEQTVIKVNKKDVQFVEIDKEAA